MIELEEVIIELSYNCNLSCTMCGFGKHVNPFKKEKFLSFDNYKIILEQIGNLTKTIRLNGRGESTIHPRFVDILNYTKEKHPNLNINLFSNFSFRSHKILKSLIDNNVQLFVSLDSSNKVELEAIRKGANFHHIEQNIKNLNTLINRPFIIFTIQESNIHRISDIAEFARKYNCQMLFNTIRRDEGIEVFVDLVKNKYQEIVSQFNMVREIYKDSNLQCLIPNQLAGIKLEKVNSNKTHGTMNSCPILDKELCILYDGTVTPCNMFNPYVYGNIFNETLSEIWKGENRLNFLKTHKNHYYCNNCSNLGV